MTIGTRSRNARLAWHDDLCQAQRARLGRFFAHSTMRITRKLKAIQEEPKITLEQRGYTFGGGPTREEYQDE